MIAGDGEDVRPQIEDAGDRAVRLFGSLYLGIEITLSPSKITFGLTQNRLDKLQWHISDRLDRNHMSTSEASSLAGRLAFANTALFGRIGRAPLNPIFDRANAKSPRPILNQNLRNALLWWQKVLQCGPEHWQRTAGRIEVFWSRHI